MNMMILISKPWSTVIRAKTAPYETDVLMKIRSFSFHVCLLANDSVQCVGYNYYGQIGQSTSNAFGTPVLLSFPSGIDNAKPVKVVTGYVHTCTLFDNKSVWCNESNGYGQLGDTSSANSAIPVQVKEGSAALADVTDIEAGAYHNCAIKSTGAMYCWGFNTDGQLSLNDTMNGGTDDATKVSKMALSMSLTCVVTVNLSTSVTCVGFGFSSTSTPTTATGSTHICALLDVESKAKCWGTNHAGQRGIGFSDYNPLFDSAEYVLDSYGVSPLSGIADINAGYSSTCLVLSNGNAMCFGNNQYYQLGIGNRGTKVLSPTNVPITSVSGKTLVSVYVGEQTVHAVFNDNSVYSWGTNYGGTFGDGSSISSLNIIGSGGGSAVATEMKLISPSFEPSGIPSSVPSGIPSSVPSSIPSDLPSDFLPSDFPSQSPSATPTFDRACHIEGRAGYVCLQTDLKTYSDSVQAAQNAQDGANLVSIRCSEQQAKVNLLPLVGVDNWIGANYIISEGIWVLADGHAMTYTNWNTNGPNNAGAGEDCVTIKPDGLWNDGGCSYTFRAVYESPHVNECTTNVALVTGTTATQSSTAYSAPASRAIDGSTVNNVDGVLVTHTDEETDPWWEVQLTKEYSISKVVVYNRDEGYDSNNEVKARLNNFPMSVLLNGIEVFRYDNNASLANVVTSIVVPSNVIGNAVKIQTFGNARVLTLAEVEVEGLCLNWTQVGAAIIGSNTGDFFGTSMSLSADGRTVAVGAYGSDENGSNAGQNRVFHLSQNGAWEQLGQSLNGQAAGNQSGQAIALSPDGSTVAIGDHLRSSNGFTNNGDVRIYRLNKSISTWELLGTNIEGLGDNYRLGWECGLVLSEDGNTIAVGAWYYIVVF